MSQRVYAAIKKAIVELGFQPGDSLSEADVARQFGVSRQPVREAFIKLAEVGLVEVRPKRGTFVRLISQREVGNARFIRAAIESAVAARAAQMSATRDISWIEPVIAAQTEAAGNGDLLAFMELDERFHREIARLADCGEAWVIVEDLKVQFDRVRYLSLSAATPVATLVEQHRQIAEAIRVGDAERAKQAVEAHLMEVLVSLPKIAAERPELFAD